VVVGVPAGVRVCVRWGAEDSAREQAISNGLRASTARIAFIFLLLAALH